MKILYISDIHLGNPLVDPSIDDLITLLTREDFTSIFLVGDIFDIWENSITEIQKKYSKLIACINELALKKCVIMVKGNHDPSIEILREILYNVRTIAYMYSHNNDIVIHGDEFDKLVTKYSWWAKVIWPLQWFPERFGINVRYVIRNIYYSIAAQKSKKFYNDLVTDIEIHLFNKYKKNFDNIIVGHTHQPKIVVKDNKTYVNCGSWVQNKNYVIYNNKSNKFDLI